MQSMATQQFEMELRQFVFNSSPIRVIKSLPEDSHSLSRAVLAPSAHTQEAMVWLPSFTFTNWGLAGTNSSWQLAD